MSIDSRKIHVFVDVVAVLCHKNVKKMGLTDKLNTYIFKLT